MSHEDSAAWLVLLHPPKSVSSNSKRILKWYVVTYGPYKNSGTRILMRNVTRDIPTSMSTSHVMYSIQDKMTGTKFTMESSGNLIQEIP